MNIPSNIRAGVTVKWREESSSDPFDNPISSPDWTAKYYLRTNVNLEGHTVTGTEYAGGWEFSIAHGDTANFDAGIWYWQFEATKGAEKFQLGSGQLTVLQTLSYTGNPAALDGRSQAVKDLEDVETAIRAIATGRSKEYIIGDRTFKSLDLAELRKWRSDLRNIVVREQKANNIANGLGNPHSMYVRF